MTTIIAGIVLYNPDPVRLKENIEAIRTQVEMIVLVDNASSDKNYLSVIDSDKIVLVKNTKNEGIAFALNQILQFAYDAGYGWVLTLDQDSVATDGMIQGLSKFLSHSVGIVCPYIKDRNFKRYFDDLDYDVREVKVCITSGSLTNVEAWKDVGGFDNYLFIDWVDWDFCYSLTEKGYKILQTRRACLLHELGEKTKYFHVGSHELFLLHRTPKRYYYIARNDIIIAKKHKKEHILSHLLFTIKSMLVVILFEKNRYRNLCAFINGIKDGFLYRS